MVSDVSISPSASEPTLTPSASAMLVRVETLTSETPRSMRDNDCGSMPALIASSNCVSPCFRRAAAMRSPTMSTTIRHKRLAVKFDCASPLKSALRAGENG